MSRQKHRDLEWLGIGLICACVIKVGVTWALGLTFYPWAVYVVPFFFGMGVVLWFLNRGSDDTIHTIRITKRPAETDDHRTTPSHRDDGV